MQKKKQKSFKNAAWGSSEPQHDFHEKKQVMFYKFFHTPKFALNPRNKRAGTKRKIFLDKNTLSEHGRARKDEPQFLLKKSLMADFMAGTFGME